MKHYLFALVLLLPSLPAFAEHGHKEIGCYDAHPCSGDAPGIDEASCSHGRVYNFNVNCGTCSGGPGSGSGWILTWDCTGTLPAPGPTDPAGDPKHPTCPGPNSSNDCAPEAF